MDEEPVKASKYIAGGAKFSFREGPYWRTFKVLEIPKSRVGASLVKDYLSEETDEQTLNEIQTYHLMRRKTRAEGVVGRPTKKDRRRLDRFRRDD